MVQAEALDQYLGAEGYRVNGKTYTMDGISIAALSRFHSAKETKKFLTSIDRRNPNITPAMVQTLEKFHGMSHDLDLGLLPIRNIVGAGGKIFREKDFRTAFALPDFGENDYIIMLEIKAFKESSFNPMAGIDGNYWGTWQQRKDLVKSALKAYNEKYDKEYGVKDFFASQSLQRECIMEYHKQNSLYNGHAGLAEFLPYVSNRNIVELEYVNPIKDIEKNFIKSPEQLKGAKQVKAGDGITEFGFQVGATYRLSNGRLAKVVDVGTRSRQNHPLGFLSQSHLGGAGNVDKSYSKQMRYNKANFSDGNGTSIMDYFFITDHVLNKRTLQDAIDNPEFEVPMKNGRLRKEYRTSEILKPMEKFIAPIRAIKGRPTFNEAEYQKKYAEPQKTSKKHASVEMDQNSAEQGSWHQRVGQMSNKERQQHGIS